MTHLGLSTRGKIFSVQHPHCEEIKLAEHRHQNIAMQTTYLTMKRGRMCSAGCFR